MAKITIEVDAPDGLTKEQIEELKSRAALSIRDARAIKAHDAKGRIKKYREVIEKVDKLLEKELAGETIVSYVERKEKDTEKKISKPFLDASKRLALLSEVSITDQIKTDKNGTITIWNSKGDKQIADEAIIRTNTLLTNGRKPKRKKAEGLPVIGIDKLSKGIQEKILADVSSLKDENDEEYDVSKGFWLQIEKKTLTNGK